LCGPRCSQYARQVKNFDVGERARHKKGSNFVTKALL
jgi:hypothetical protein